MFNFYFFFKDKNIINSFKNKNNIMKNKFKN